MTTEHSSRLSNGGSSLRQWFPAIVSVVLFVALHTGSLLWFLGRLSSEVGSLSRAVQELRADLRTRPGTGDFDSLGDRLSRCEQRLDSLYDRIISGRPNVSRDNP